MYFGSWLVQITWVATTKRTSCKHVYFSTICSMTHCCHRCLSYESTLIPTFFKINRQYASTIPKQSAENLFCRMVEITFFWHWLAYFMLNSSIFFLCQGDEKNSQFITCNDTQNHYRIKCLLHQEFLGWVNSHLFVLVNQQFGYPSLTYFCVTLSSKNASYNHVRNLIPCSSTNRS